MRRFDLHLRPQLAPTRRETIAGLAATLAACATKREGGDTGTTTPATIDHIIVVMMENRSFDHFFGARKLVEGLAVDGLDATMSNPDSRGELHYVAPATIDCVADPPHSWRSSHDQWNDGTNDGFVREYEGAPEVGEVMGYMTREDLPVSYALADAYTLCERYFCSVMGPTWPNRFYGHAGTSDGQDNNEWPDGGAFTFPTVWSKLDEAGIDWTYYYTDLPFIGLFDNCFRPGFYGLLEDFVYDAAHGTLSPVVWIDPGFAFCDDHPPHHVAMGQEFLRTVYEAIASSPLWNRCLLLITYDEHGGFFDHVPPPTTEDDHAEQGFDQLGFRVPSVVVGPFVKQGVCSETLDHTSWLKFVCERFGIEPWTTRIAAATSLGVVLDQDRMTADDPRPPAAVPAFDFDDSTLGDECIGQGVLGPQTDETTPVPTEACGQVELAAWVRQFHPAADHTTGAAARFLKMVKARRG